MFLTLLELCSACVVASEQYYSNEMRDYKLSEARELRNFSGLSGRKQSLKKIKAGKGFIPVTFEFPVQLYH